MFREIALMIVLSQPPTVPEGPPPVPEKVSAPEKVSVKPGCGCAFGDVCRCSTGKCDCLSAKSLSYPEASAQAIREGKPLVVFLDGPRHVQNFASPVPGAICCSVESLSGFTGPVVIVSVPKNGTLWHYDPLPAWSTASDITKEVSRVLAMPFRRSIQQLQSAECANGNCPVPTFPSAVSTSPKFRR